MQTWLSYDNNKERLLLPVNPESFEVSRYGMNTKVDIVNAGALNLIGNVDLDAISLTSHFPSEYRSYCQYSGFPSPYECVQKIRRWQESHKPIRLIVTGTVINHAMAIDSFTYGEAGPTGDVSFTLELSEYRFLDSNPKNGQTPSNYGLVTDLGKRGGKSVPYLYRCIAGDTFIEIARKTTGNSGNASVIMEKNGITNPSAIFEGLELLIDGY